MHVIIIIIIKGCFYNTLTFYRPISMAPKKKRPGSSHAVGTESDDVEMNGVHDEGNGCMRLDRTTGFCSPW